MSNIWVPKITVATNAALSPAGNPPNLDGEYKTIDYYALAPDDELLNLNSQPDDPCSIYTDNPYDIADIQTAFETLIGAPPTSSNELQFQVQHEIEHGVAASRLGAVALLYGVNFKTFGGYIELTPFMLSTGWRMTKLDFAISLAAPTVPSDGDVSAIKRLGYKDVDDVLARV